MVVSVAATLHQSKEIKSHENQGGQQHAYIKSVSNYISHFLYHPTKNEIGLHASTHSLKEQYDNYKIVSSGCTIGLKSTTKVTISTNK